MVVHVSNRLIAGASPFEHDSHVFPVCKNQLQALKEGHDGGYQIPVPSYFFVPNPNSQLLEFLQSQPNVREFWPIPNSQLIFGKQSQFTAIFEGQSKVPVNRPQDPPQATPKRWQSYTPNDWGHNMRSLQPSNCNFIVSLVVHDCHRSRACRLAHLNTILWYFLFVRTGCQR